MNVAGIDLSTKAIDVVWLNLDDDRAEWNRFPLEGVDLVERVRDIRCTALGFNYGMWDDTLAIGIERPAGKFGVAQTSMAFGAVLACLPREKLVQPWQPAEWRKACGLKGNASKEDVYVWAGELWPNDTITARPQDALDAYAIAYATRSALEPVKQAA